MSAGTRKRKRVREAMLTREQKRWMVIGFCTNTGNSVGCLMCKISHICDSIKANYGDFTDAELDACMEIIAPELVEEPKPAATPQWISVEDKLPDAFKPVIICRKYVKGTLRIEQGYWDVNGWWMIYGARVKRVTHWMPMPEPPEEVQA